MPPLRKRANSAPMSTASDASLGSMFPLRPNRTRATPNRPMQTDATNDYNPPPAMQYRYRNVATSSGGTTPATLSRRSSMSLYRHSNIPSIGSGIVRQFGAMAVNEPKILSVVPPVNLNPYQEAVYMNHLAIARQKYIQSLKKKIFNGDTSSKQNKYGMTTGPSKLYTAMETAAEKKGNQLFLFPDSDPAVYRRKINYPNVFRHEPVYGF